MYTLQAPQNLGPSQACLILSPLTYLNLIHPLKHWSVPASLTPLTCTHPEILFTKKGNNKVSTAKVSACPFISLVPLNNIRHINNENYFNLHFVKISHKYWANVMFTLKFNISALHFTEINVLSMEVICLHKNTSLISYCLQLSLKF